MASVGCFGNCSQSCRMCCGATTCGLQTSTFSFPTPFYPVTALCVSSKFAFTMIIQIQHMKIKAFPNFLRCRHNTHVLLEVMLVNSLIGCRSLYLYYFVSGKIVCHYFETAEICLCLFMIDSDIRSCL